MVFRFKVEGPDLALTPDLHVVGIVPARRDIFIGRLGDFEHKCVEFRLELLDPVFVVPLPLFQSGEFIKGGLLLLARQSRDGLADTVLLRCDLLELLLGLEQGRIHFKQPANINVEALGLGRLPVSFWIVAYLSDVYHSGRPGWFASIFVESPDDDNIVLPAKAE